MRVSASILIVWIMGMMPLKAQDKLFLESFNTNIDTTWKFRNSSFVKNASAYSGEGFLQVRGAGDAYYFVEIPEGVKEITLSGWMKVSGVKKNQSFVQKKYDPSWGDTVVITPQIQAMVSLFVLGVQESSIKKISLLKAGNEIYLVRNSGWIYFERELKVPPGVARIKLLCRNTIEGSVAGFDEIRVEKRQTGFVRNQSSWANSVKEFQKTSEMLVKNGSFESGAENWDPYWGFNLSDIAHSGKYSCLIQNSDSGAWKGSGNMKLFKIPEGTTWLKVSAWIKADQVKPGPNAWETGALLVSMMDSKGNEVPGGEALARSVGTHDWKKFEYIYPVSDRTKQFKLLLQLAASTGKIYFDDIEALPLNDEQYLKESIQLKNPGFESLLSGWPTYAGVATSDQAHTGEYSLCVGGTDAAWEMRMQTVSLEKGKKSITLGAWLKAVNVTESPNTWEGGRLYVEFKDINGLVLLTENVARIIGNTDWMESKQTLSIPEDAVYMTISCGRANVSGKVYFDDIRIEY